jgi:hypothetical protein
MLRLRRVYPAVLLVLALAFLGIGPALAQQLAVPTIGAGEPGQLSPATVSWLMGLGPVGALVLGAFALGGMVQVMSTRLKAGLVIRHEHSLSEGTREFLEDLYATHTGTTAPRHRPARVPRDLDDAEAG